MHNRENFTAYETMPADLAIYLSHYGPHFNKECCKFAVSQMYKKDDSGREQDIEPISKGEVEDCLKECIEDEDIEYRDYDYDDIDDDRRLRRNERMSGTRYRRGRM